MIVQTFVSLLSDFLMLGALIWLLFRTIRRRKGRSDDANRYGRIALSDDSWWDQLRKWNPKGSEDD